VTFEKAVDQLQARIHPLARFVHGFANTLDPPVMVRASGGFRYSKPDFRHFCLLRSCRMVSALNGSIQLARCGYPQEIGVLYRVVQESSSQIRAVMAQITTDGHVGGKIAEFIDAYFEDAHRGESSPPSSQAKLSQKYVNELIGSQLDQFSSLSPADPNWKSAAERYWHIDWVFSNYVHGRYPEVMDLYGGTPGRFHLFGMQGTPKDMENIEALDVFITTASRCLMGLVQGLQLRDVLAQDPMLAEWYGNLGDAS
jgi:hypothetical protein